MTATRNRLPEHQPCVILYAEDDDALAYLFQRALEEQQTYLRLFRVTDGEEALAFLRREGSYREAPAPNLVILDVRLPKMDGLAVLAEAQKIEALKQVPKVMFSSSTEAEYHEEAKRLGANRLFSKNGFDAFVQTAKEICSMLSQGDS
jgi:two-component system response regulator